VSGSTRSTSARRFFGDVSHELRNPVTTLVTAVGVLRHYRDDLPARAGAAFDLVEADVARLHRLLTHLLALARAEAAPRQNERETLALAALIEKVLTATGHPTDLLTVERDGKVNGSELALERAFVNLVDNADRHGEGLTGITVSNNEVQALGGRICGPVALHGSTPRADAAQRVPGVEEAAMSDPRPCQSPGYRAGVEPTPIGPVSLLLGMWT
jgi:K+-sensing histidine kinase KdpD